jgi:hypothetical protein
MADLQACPFCKHVQQQSATNPDAFAKNGKGKFCVVCDECGAMGPMVTGMVQCIDAWNKRDLSHPTTVQGEALPVVGTVQHLNELNDEWLDKLPIGMTLTDHAQATAEIARLQGEVDKRDAEIVRLTVLHDAIRSAYLKASALEDYLSEELATLRTQLSDTNGQVGKLREALDNAEQAFVRIEMQLGHRLINGEMHEAPAGSMGELSEIATDALYDLRAALNSTALDTPHTQG